MRDVILSFAPEIELQMFISLDMRQEDWEIYLPNGVSQYSPYVR